MTDIIDLSDDDDCQTSVQSTLCPLPLDICNQLYPEQGLFLKILKTNTDALQLLWTKGDIDKSTECIVEVNKPNENHSELYYEVSKTNQHLANFIDACLNLENTTMMLKILRTNLLKEYYELEKSVRESSKIQKAIRRANNLLNTHPRLKHNHIKDLCEIFKASKVKKKVPFITLTTSLQGKHNEKNSLKRCNNTQINGTSCKKPKLNTDNLEITSHSTEVPVMNLNDTADILHESTALANSSQESITDEENFLVPQMSVSVAPNTPSDEERIKKLEKRLAYYQREIARLDELEVDDDSINSPYVKSERLKSAIVVIYKELCQLMGSQPVKRKEIRLRVVTGHPPGPTRVLETFLNNNIGSDGQPPFPDFCDVVNCVMEANKMDDLGWTKCQIMKEAGMLFTQCGRALQKRRQNREYRDLLCKVKEEDCQRDPAEDDPELLARLEENKRIAIKKESEILERYTMMESLPSKPKIQKNGAIIKNKGNEEINEATTTQEALNHNNNSIVGAKHNVGDECKNSDNIIMEVTTVNSSINDHKSSIEDESNKSVDVASQASNISDQNAIYDHRNNDIDKENKESRSNFVDKEAHNNHNIDNQKTLKVRYNINKENEDINFVHSKADVNAESDKLVPDCSIENTSTEVTDSVQKDNHGVEKILDTSNNITDSSIESNGKNVNLKENDFGGREIKQEPEEELSSLLASMGDDFSFVIENIEHSTVIIEISDSSDDEFDK